MPRPILILGGTSEACDLAEAVLAQGAGPVITSLAGRTRQPRVPPGECRQGGFGGVPGLVAYLRQQRIRAVVDATHPFAFRMGENAAAACAQCHIPLLRLERPLWQAQAGDDWLMVDDWSQAAELLRTRYRRALLAIGRQDVGEFLCLPQVFLLVRLITRPEPPLVLAQGEILCQQGPFSVQAERELMQRYRLECVVCKNSGGPASAKLTAARQLGLTVILRQRPKRPHGLAVQHIPQAVQWLTGLPDRPIQA